MNEAFLNTWRKIATEDRLAIFREVANRRGLPASVIEKDWWVMLTLRAVFSMTIAPQLVFKGGTSLSKAWNLIERFSEDIDLALDRTYLGYGGTLSATKVKRLRADSNTYISSTFFPELRKVFNEAGFNDVTVDIVDVKSPDQDPILIQISYHSITEPLGYINPRVLVEIGSRSLREPFENKTFSSFVGQFLSGQSYSDPALTIPTVNPERTFLEKVFLLHEEFQKHVSKIRIDRLSRHLFDLEKLMDTAFGMAALGNMELYYTIVEHRKMINAIRGIDYSRHTPATINLTPPAEVISAWEKDYSEMRENMFFGSSLSFEDLMERIQELQRRINAINF